MIGSLYKTLWSFDLFASFQPNPSCTRSFLSELLFYVLYLLLYFDVSTWIILYTHIKVL